MKVYRIEYEKNTTFAHTCTGNTNARAYFTLISAYEKRAF